MDYKKWRQEIKHRFKAQPKRYIPRQDSFTYRNTMLKQDGFLWFERKYLAVNRIDTEAWQAVKDWRRREFALWAGFPLEPGHGVPFKLFNAWQRHIGDMYRREGWYFKGTKRLNPFAMFEAIKEREGAPNTPQPKKKRVRKDYIDYKQRSLSRKPEVRRW